MESVLSHRLHFYEAVQQPGQSIPEYLAVLRSLARPCKFTVKSDSNVEVDYSDSVIKDQLIRGMSSDEDRQRLLAEPKLEEFSLEQVVDFIQRQQISEFVNMKGISDLPREILMRCFYSLAPPDLKSCVLVSEEWRAVGEDPSLWTWCTVTIRSGEDLEKLSVRRLRKIQRIRFEPEEDWDDGDWEEFLHDVAAKTYPKLKQIYGLKDSNLFSVNIEPEVIARAIVQLEDVDLSNTSLSTTLINSILTCISTEDNNLKKLNLQMNYLSGVEPEDLTRSVIKLEEVDLGDTYLRTDQITCILKNIAQEETKLKKMNLSRADLSEVEPEDLARGLIQLEDVNLKNTELTTEQITRILTNMAQEETKLKKLNLANNDLHHIEPVALARGFTKLEEVILRETELWTDHIRCILINLAQEETKLKKLDLANNDLKYVEPEALGRGFIKLEEMDLRRTELTTEQITSILTNMAQEETKLKKVNLSEKNLSAVEPEALDRGLIQLEEVDLSNTKLTTEQITSILTNIAQEETKLKVLKLADNDLYDVEPEALPKVLTKLEEMDLSRTELTTEQSTGIFTNMAQEETKLKKLNLKYNDLSGVEPEALAKGLIQLEEVDLCRTQLTIEEINSILTNIAQEETKLKKLDLGGILTGQQNMGDLVIQWDEPDEYTRHEMY